MTPNDVLPTAATRPGKPRFAWLKRLNTSRRNCTRALPASARFLITEKSVFPKPGPRIALRPRLPKWNTPAAFTGSANTEPAPQEPAPVAMRGSHVVLLNHCVGEPRTDASPTRSGLRVLTTPVRLPSAVTTFT